MRLLIAALLIILSVFSCILWLNNREVNVVDAHYDGGSAQVIVDKLPLTNSAKIGWWKRNQDQIRKKYNIPDKDKSPMLIVIYAFGDGYKEEGKEDRLCFDDMKPPRNCIDKDILMMIWRTRDGGVKYDF